MKNKYQNPFDVIKSRNYINLGFTDYIAARVLINQGLLPQGLILASTSIEKYFKAILILGGRASRKHLNAELCKAVSEFDPDLYKSLNSSFLELLIKCYKMRYLDDVPNGFSIVFIQYPALAELDYSVSKIESQFRIFQDGQKLELGYKQMWDRRDPQFTENNYVFNGISKTEFIANTESKVHCLRIESGDLQRPLIEITYTAAKQSHDGNFQRDFTISDYPTAVNPLTGFTLPFIPRSNNK